MLEYIKYNETVLVELEKLKFPQVSYAAHLMGVPEDAIAQYIALMSRACFLEKETPQSCAEQITVNFLKTFENALLDILMESINFPSE